MIRENIIMQNQILTRVDVMQKFIKRKECKSKLEEFKKEMEFEG